MLLKQVAKEVSPVNGRLAKHSYLLVDIRLQEEDTDEAITKVIEEMDKAEVAY
jgi:hypothetical protein